MIKCQQNNNKEKEDKKKSKIGSRSTNIEW